MKSKLISTAAILGAISVILGALAAHQLKNVLTPTSLDAFDKGVRYQIYHSLLLLLIAFSYNKENERDIKPIAILIIVGVVLFSFSIYLLSTQSLSQINFSILGPITPIGGICMILAWILLAIKAKRIFNN
ncbi:MAG TPA: DUF423 domain-containing protein [Bacteroidia bacterium]|nr:DUF423 domain-containing protein [Bacteroidia bacterium]